MLRAKEPLVPPAEITPPELKKRGKFPIVRKRPDGTYVIVIELKNENGR